MSYQLFAKLLYIFTLYYNERLSLYGTKLFREKEIVGPYLFVHRDTFLKFYIVNAEPKN